MGKSTAAPSPAKKASAKRSAPKKAAPKKVAKKKELKIKYEDKSKGQPKVLVTIWNNIKELMEPYEKGDMKALGGKGGQYGLVNHKPYEVEGRKRNELWFAGILIQKGYVGFYFMPVYVESEMKKIFQPELLKCLKGKSCFYIKKDDPQLYAQIEDALRLGYEVYRKKGWL